MPEPRILLGLHCDMPDAGIDAVAVELRGHGEPIRLQQRAHGVHPLPEELRSVLNARPETPGLPPETELDLRLGRAMADAAVGLSAEAGLKHEDVTAVGVLGLRRAGSAGGVRTCGLPEAVAQGTGLPAVGRFAASDIAAGGNGAAVWAWPAWRLLRHDRLSRVLVHIGQVTSLVFVGSGAEHEEVVAFDAGAGAGALDALAARLLDVPGDADGALAARGRFSAELVHELLAHPHHRQVAPKACDPHEWGTTHAQRIELIGRKHGCEGPDLLATAVEAVAAAVEQAVGELTERPHDVILAGLGAANITLARRIRFRLSPSSTYTVERYGLGLRAVPATAAAVLAAAQLDGFPAHCPAASGATRAAVLGSVSVP